jgi:ribosomal protein L3 glutamine methyltransferase
MATVSHKQKSARRATATKPAVTVARALRRAARRLERAGVWFGHGTDNAIDDAAVLLWHVLGLGDASDPRLLTRRLTRRQQMAFEALLERRISTREPAVYITGHTWFAGLPMRTDARALVPRSPLAELIEQRFEPWIDSTRVRRVLDVGTGGGCIALACAHYLPAARVDAVDISDAALALARENRAALGLSRRVRFVKSDHFSALKGRSYDIIVSNPPYVGRREMRSLPDEYGHEPRIALASGDDGLDSVKVLLSQAARHLNPGGLLIVEVGNTEILVRRRFPRVPFLWLEFERGGGGVFCLTREQLQRHVR